MPSAKLPFVPLLLAAAVAALASPAASTSLVDQPATSPLSPGQYLWLPERSPSGPLAIIVSIPEQRAYVYRNGVEIGVSTASTGRPGFETPTGVFTILEKKKEHVSNLYEDAEMPYMQRLTWSGVALHAGHIPGYPASHGCIRLPLEFAKRLFDVTTRGTTVLVVDTANAPAPVVSPGVTLPALAPDLAPGPPAATAPTAQEGAFFAPELAPEGPLAVVVTGADRRLHVYRNGVLIGRGEIEVRGSAPLPHVVFTMLEGTTEEPNAWVPGRATPRFAATSFDADPEAAARAATEIRERLRVPPALAVGIFELLSPGATILITPERSSNEEAGRELLDAATEPGPSDN